MCIHYASTRLRIKFFIFVSLGASRFIIFQPNTSSACKFFTVRPSTCVEITRLVMTPAEVKDLAELFEKTSLELSIVEALHGGGGDGVSDYVKNVFQTSVEELRHFGTLKTLHGDGAARKREEIGPRNRFELRAPDGREKKPLQRRSDDGQRGGDDAQSLEKNLEALKQKQEDIDLAIEKCIENGERMAMRREMEKNYVDKWEKARVENFKLRFKAEDLAIRREIKKLQARLDTEQIVDAENEKFLDHSIAELEKQIEYWEGKYTTDIIEMNEKLENLMVTLKEKTKEVENLKNTYNERQTIIEEHEKDKRKLEEEKRINDYKEKMATKIQAWWRGNMVRRRLGPYKHLLGPRKKSIKKPLVNKGKKTKDK